MEETKQASTGGGETQHCSILRGGLMEDLKESGRSVCKAKRNILE